jgi:hypothetical protein
VFRWPAGILRPICGTGCACFQACKLPEAVRVTSTRRQIHPALQAPAQLPSCTRALLWGQQHCFKLALHTKKQPAHHGACHDRSVNTAHIRSLGLPYLFTEAAPAAHTSLRQMELHTKARSTCRHETAHARFDLACWVAAWLQPWAVADGATAAAHMHHDLPRHTTTWCQSAAASGCCAAHTTVQLLSTEQLSSCTSRYTRSWSCSRHCCGGPVTPL